MHDLAFVFAGFVVGLVSAAVGMQLGSNVVITGTVPAFLAGSDRRASTAHRKLVFNHGG